MAQGFALSVAIAAIAMTLPVAGWTTPTAPKKSLTAFGNGEELAAGPLLPQRLQARAGDLVLRTRIRVMRVQ